MDKKIGLEHTIRNIVQESIGGPNTDKFKGTPKAFLQPAPHIEPKVGDSHPDGSSVAAKRGLAKIRTSETMKEEENIEEGWYNPITNKTYPTKEASMAAAKEAEAWNSLPKDQKTNRPMIDIPGNKPLFNPVTRKYEQKTKEQIEAEFAKRERANQSQSEFENKIKKVSTPQQTTSTNKVNPAEKVSTPQQTTSTNKVNPAEKVSQPTTDATTPKTTRPSTGERVKGFAKGWGGTGALFGAVDAASKSYADKKDLPNIVAHGAAGGVEGGTSGLWMLPAGISNAIEGTAKTLGLREPTPGKTEAGKLSQTLNPKDEKEKDWGAAALTGTAVRRGIYDPSETAKPELPPNVSVPDKKMTTAEKLQKAVGAPLEAKRKFDVQHPIASIPMAVPAAALGTISGVLGAAEGGLSKYGETGIKSIKDAKEIAKGALWGGLKSFRSGAEMPYKTYQRVVGEEKENKKIDIIKKALAEAKLPKETILKTKIPDLKTILPKITSTKIKDVNIDGHTIYDVGDGVHQWIDKNRKTVTPEIADTLNKKLLQQIETSKAQQAAEIRAEPGNIQTSKQSPYLARQAEKLKNTAAGTTLSNLPRFANEPSGFKLAEPAPVVQTAGKEPQLQKITAQQQKTSLPFAEKPNRIEFKIADVEPATQAQTTVATRPEVKTTVKPATTTGAATQAQTTVATRPEVKTTVKPATQAQTTVATRPEVKTTAQQAQKKIQKKEEFKRFKRGAPIGLPGVSVSPDVISGLKGFVPVKPYLHFAQDYVQFGEAVGNAADEERKSIENVARPGGKTRVTKQAEIKNKIIDENVKRAKTIRKVISDKKESTVILKPKLENPELDEN